MITLLIIVAVIWAYSAVVLAVAWQKDYGRVPLIEALKIAAIIFILCPLLAYAAHIDFYEESEG